MTDTYRYATAAAKVGAILPPKTFKAAKDEQHPMRTVNGTTATRQNIFMSILTELLRTIFALFITTQCLTSSTTSQSKFSRLYLFLVVLDVAYEVFTVQCYQFYQQFRKAQDITVLFTSRLRVLPNCSLISDSIKKADLILEQS